MLKLHATYDVLTFTSRADGLRNAPAETFAYDDLNRLTHRNSQLTARYATNGNLLKKRNRDGSITDRYSYSGGSSLESSTDDFLYSTTHPHAVAGAGGWTMDYDSNGNMISRNSVSANEVWAFRWNGFDKPRWLGFSENYDYEYGNAFVYGVNRQRIVNYSVIGFSNMELSPSHWIPSGYSRKRLYVGAGMEVDYDRVSGNWEAKRLRIYISAPGGVIGSAELDPQADSVSDHRFVVYHHDHLGSIESITDWGQGGSGNPWTLYANSWNTSSPRKSLYHGLSVAKSRRAKRGECA